jgi:membrane protein
MKKIRSAFILLKHTAIAFSNDNGLKLSASLSYFTIFALGPLLLIIISLSGIFLTKENVEGRIYDQLNGLIGSEAALQIENIITNAQGTHATTAGAVIGFIILFIGATGVFTEMQSSINFIWSVKAKPKKGWLKYLINRAISFSLVIGLGFLLLVSLTVNALLTLMNTKLIHRFPRYNPELFNVANTLVILAVISALFAVIYKVLPDAVISWKDAWIGSIFTAGLFLVGKFLIGLYLGRANLGLTYGTAASIIIILTWIYYSSVILYFGAEFTKIYALHSGEGIRPKQTAVFIIKKESKEVPTSYLDT